MSDTTTIDALAALAGQRLRLERLEKEAPSRPGLYAFYVDPDAQRGLDWTQQLDDGRLYVGKSESSLRTRDVTTHFGEGKTGWSTVRRSLAVLLREELELQAVPRNDTLPVRPANYGLAPGGERRLSEWMRGNLTLAFWQKPDGVVLKPVETAVISKWQPPLNLDKIEHASQVLTRGRRDFANDVRRAVGLPLRAS